MQKSQIAQEIGRFAGHVLTGLVLFLVVLIATLLASLAVDAVVGWFTDAYIIDGLKLVKRILFTMDVMFLVVWVAYSMWIAIRALLLGRHEGEPDSDPTNGR